MQRFSDLIKLPARDLKTARVTISDTRKVMLRCSIQKADADQHLAFGWASVIKTAAGSTVEDYQGDIIELDELETAAYAYVEFYRDSGEMHERGGCAVLVESMVFTQEKMAALGIPAGTLPIGWWIGFHVTDEDVWQKVKSGEYTMFSIEGRAKKVKC